MSFSRYLILFAVSILVYHFAFSCFICVFFVICGLLFTQILCYFLRFCMVCTIFHAPLNKHRANGAGSAKIVFHFSFPWFVFFMYRCVCFVIVPCASHSCMCVMHFFEISLFFELFLHLLCFVFMSKFVLHALSNCSIYCSMVFACLASLSQAPLFNKHHTDKGPAEALLHVLVLTTLCWRAPTSSPSDLKPLGAPD